MPTVGGDRPAAEPWPAILHIGVERQPAAVHTYDDGVAVYDDPAPADFFYDDTTAWPYDRLDMFCRFHGLTITTGAPDEEGLYDAGHIEATLDNRDGALSQYNAAGQLTDWIPGAHVDVFAEVDGDDWWLFSGRVTVWRETAEGTVELEAFDAFSELNQERPDWTPGNIGDTPAQRLTKIAVAAGYTGPSRFDAGTVTLLTELTDETPLEAMQRTAASDGGVVAVDADGTLVYRDRGWYLGRSDQMTIPMFSDNYCTVPNIVWDAQITTDDLMMVNRAELVNVATPTPITVVAANQHSLDRYGLHTLPRRRDDDLWQIESDGQALAEYLVSRFANHYLRLEEFTLYVHDPNQDLWRPAIDLRLGDIITWVHVTQTTGGAIPIVLDCAIQAIIHEITPDEWMTTVATTRTVAYRTPGLYDRTPYRYDDPNPANIYIV